MERIFSLQLHVKNPNVPFAIHKSIGVDSGDLIKVFAQFQLELVRLLNELHEEDLKEQLELNGIGGDDGVPF